MSMVEQMIMNAEQEIEEQYDSDEEGFGTGNPHEMVMECKDCKCCRGYPYGCQNDEMCV